MRYPFLDRRHADFVLAIPWEERIPGGYMKRILRDAMKERLPPEVAFRHGVTSFETATRAHILRHERALRDLFSAGRWLSAPYVDRRAIMRLLEGLTRGDVDARDPSWSTPWLVASLETWLRRLDQG